MKLIITIDTEEDNWAHYHPVDNPVTNIEQIPEIQNLFNHFGFKPTYLITYPVATHPKSIKILQAILEKGQCEIGMHCHPWNTPPLDIGKKIAVSDTMLCNYSPEKQQAKLEVLNETIASNFSTPPVSFRAGRFGIGDTAIELLFSLGYRVDSSISPLIDWRPFGPDFSHFGPEMFWISSETRNSSSRLLEVPATVGFLQSNFKLCQQILTKLEKPFFSKLRLPGIFSRLNLLNKVWLSPEEPNELMIGLAKRMEKIGFPVLNLTFHSASLKIGSSPFVKTPADKKKFISKLKAFLLFASQRGYESMTLSQLEEHVRNTASIGSRRLPFLESNSQQGSVSPVFHN